MLMNRLNTVLYFQVLTNCNKVSKIYYKLDKSPHVVYSTRSAHTVL